MTENELLSKDTELFVFDLDGTLAPSKQPIERGMVALLSKLIAERKVAVIGGGSFILFEKQFKPMMESGDPNLANLSLFPTSGAQYYRSNGVWERVYTHGLAEEEKKKIIFALSKAVMESGVVMPKTTYGEVIEDRITQISISPYGQEAPLEVKKDWDLDQAKRKKIKAILDRLIPEFEVRIGGTTTIDITKKGIDKAYGVEMMQDYLGVPIEKMCFIGDALYEGGNDSAVLRTGIKTHQVESPEDTMKFIESILAV